MIPSLPGIIAGRRRVVPTNAIYDQWVAEVDANAGTYETDSKSIMLAFSNEFLAGGFDATVLYLQGFLGSNLAAQRTPLVDSFNVGIATNNGFVGADCSQATGLQGGGTNNLDLLFPPSSLDPDPPGSYRGGFGYYLATTGAAGGWCMGMNNGGGIYGLHFTPAPRELFYYGDATSPIDLADAISAGHYYAQRLTATDRKFYRNGTEIGADTDNAAIPNINLANIFLMGINNGASVTDGRCGFGYVTNGQMTPTEIADFHTLLDDYLITPTGR